jgi:hypothetical protein
MNNSKDSDVARRIILIVFIPLGLFLAVRMFQLSPKGFSYFGIFLVGGVSLYLVGMFLYKRQAKKCPQCNGSLMSLGVVKVFGGAIDIDNPNKSYTSIGKRVYECDRCELKFYELISYDSFSPDAHDSKEILDQIKQESLLILKSELPENLRNIDFEYKKISHYDYKIILNTLIKEVRDHNLSKGFDDDGIRIDFTE